MTRSYGQVPLRVYPDVTVAQYQRLISSCPRLISVRDELFTPSGAFLTVDCYAEDVNNVKHYFEQSGIAEIDRETLAEIRDSDVI